MIAMGCSFDMVENGTTERVSISRLAARLPNYYCTHITIFNDQTSRPKLASHLLKISQQFIDLLRTRLKNVPSRVMALPPHLQSDPPTRSPNPTSDASASPSTLPTPIIPILTPCPRPLAQHLRDQGFLARPITNPTVPKGEERVRVSFIVMSVDDLIP